MRCEHGKQILFVSRQVSPPHSDDGEYYVFYGCGECSAPTEYLGEEHSLILHEPECRNNPTGE